MDSHDESYHVHSPPTFEAPRTSGMANIKGDQAMARTIVAVARKKSGWMTKTFRVVSDKESPLNKKQKEDF